MSILVMGTIDSCKYRIVQRTIQIVGILNLETEYLYCEIIFIIFI